MAFSAAAGAWLFFGKLPPLVISAKIAEDHILI